MTKKQLDLLEKLINKRIVLHEDFLNSRGKEIVQADIESLRSQLTEEEHKPSNCAECSLNLAMETAINSHKPKERWKPEKGDKYWVVSDGGSAHSHLYDGDNLDKSYLEFNNCFPTKEAAEAAAKKVKELLLNL